MMKGTISEEQLLLRAAQQQRNFLQGGSRTHNESSFGQSSLAAASNIRRISFLDKNYENNHHQGAETVWDFVLDNPPFEDEKFESFHELSPPNKAGVTSGGS